MTNIAPLHGTDLTFRDRSWLASRVERARKEMFTEIVTITPDIAKTLLGSNEDNRKVSKQLIKEIVLDINNGNWELNGETIIVSRDGELNDGQQRLLAIIEANTPVQSLVAFGFPRSTRLTIDMGKQRRAADLLYMEKTKNSTNAAATARLCLLFKSNLFVAGNITKQAVRRYYEQEKTLIDLAVFKTLSNQFGRSVGSNACAAAYVILHKMNSQQCDVFFDSFFSGADLSKSDAILWLRQRVGLAPEERIRAEHKLELILRYWNAWRSEQKMQRHIKLQNTFPKVSP